MSEAAVEPVDRHADDPDRPTIEALSDQIREMEADVARLRAERRDRYRAALARGVDRAEVGRWAGVSSMAVKFDLDPPGSRRKAKKVAAPGKATAK